MSWNGNDRGEWIALPYATGWTDYGSGFVAGAYLRDASGWVHLRGMVKATSNQSAGSTIATLPSGFCPTLAEMFPGTAVGAIAAQIEINASGLVLAENAYTTGQWVSLSGICFATF